MGIPRLSLVQQEIIRCFSNEESLEVIGNLHAYGKTLASLVAIADQVTKHHCSLLDGVSVAHESNYGAPFAVLLFDAQEQAQVAYSLTQELLVTVNDNLAADNKPRIEVGLYHGKLEGGIMRANSGANTTSSTEDTIISGTISPGHILCATPRRLMHAFDNKRHGILKATNLKFFFMKNVDKLMQMGHTKKGALQMLQTVKADNGVVRTLTCSPQLPTKDRLQIQSSVHIFSYPTEMRLRSTDFLIRNDYKFSTAAKDHGSRLYDLWHYLESWLVNRGQEKGASLLIFAQTIAEANEITRFLRNHVSELPGINAGELIRQLPSKVPVGHDPEAGGRQFRGEYGYPSFSKYTRVLVAIPNSYNQEFGNNPDILIYSVDTVATWDYFQSRTGRRGYRGIVKTFLATDQVPLMRDIVTAFGRKARRVPRDLAGMLDKALSLAGPGAFPLDTVAVDNAGLPLIRNDGDQSSKRSRHRGGSRGGRGGRGARGGRKK
ncbi:hypothetical protein KC318_g4338 [Hortaea werneckii]|nr:hypothetical protein KC334_g4080 [Hortaea werneckii]KAI7025189.1 hypothetical protein KC355_g1136 [Hortaea werneckii]KAI7669912.1 hypothetical protein KC318_g4338 [Hortaea werneckii]